MSRLTVLLKKEWLEASRSYKLIWLPVAFMILGILQPLSSYYLPDILRMAGGLPEGMELMIPELSGEEVLASALSDQFDQLGMMILVISLMNMVVADKSSGMLTFMLTRSTTLSEYLASKWIANMVLLAMSLAAGLFMAWVYTALLYNTVALSALLLTFVLYLLWGALVLSFTLMLGALLTRTAGVAIIGIVVVVTLKIATLAGGFWHTINPASLSSHAVQLLTTGTLPSAAGLTALSAAVLVLACIGVAHRHLSREELPSM
ncbi:ABC transporter permease subunit [Paenibacillus sp. 1P07SE]|uniref:ABC transporter permease subunit n=1 Tax=Paenibacillus sp. 1P07SE TaxID=3132209 RepID=UPI0039A663F4